jgi:4-oxalocrotonate tautomerase
MPHVIVKLWQGRSEQQKTLLAEQITHAVMTVLGCSEEAVSVAMQDVNPQEWTEKVYKPDILNTQCKLYKKPGYDPLASVQQTGKRS